MKRRMSIILISILTAIVLLSGGYGLWEDNLIIKSDIEVVRLGPPPPSPPIESLVELESTAQDAVLTQNADEVMENGAIRNLDEVVGGIENTSNDSIIPNPNTDGAVETSVDDATTIFEEAVETSKNTNDEDAGTVQLDRKQDICETSEQKMSSETKKDMAEVDDNQPVSEEQPKASNERKENNED